MLQDTLWLTNGYYDSFHMKRLYAITSGNYYKMIPAWGLSGGTAYNTCLISSVAPNDLTFTVCDNTAARTPVYSATYYWQTKKADFTNGLQIQCVSRAPPVPVVGHQVYIRQRRAACILRRLRATTRACTQVPMIPSRVT